jgi:predicted RNase H-like HicB family nuclease
MDTMELEVIVHHDSDTGGYWAEVVQLPGCFAAGKTREELDESLAEAVRLYLEDADETQFLITDRVEGVERYHLADDHNLNPA